MKKNLLACLLACFAGLPFAIGCGGANTGPAENTMEENSFEEQQARMEERAKQEQSSEADRRKQQPKG